MPDTDLSGLNDGERTALALLAQGHTAKSIAQLTGRSVTSVNERLREARRKTGMGSSRELARLLAAQENRDKQIGVAAEQAAGAATAPEAACPGGILGKGTVTMALSIAGGAAALALLLQPQTAPKPDPLLDGILGSRQMTPRELHDRLHAEPRDAVWAPSAEAALRARYALVPRIDRDGLRVICAETLCEVTSMVAAGNDRDANDAMSVLQGSAMGSDIRALGFGDSAAMSFGGNEKNRIRFIIYWPRSNR